MAKKPNTCKIGEYVDAHGEFLLAMVELVEAAHERFTTVVGIKTNGGVRP